MPVNIQLSKISIASATGRGEACLVPASGRLVGLGRIELPTSPLSGVRSSQLSYRPGHLNSPLSSANLVELVGIEPATS